MLSADISCWLKLLKLSGVKSGSPKARIVAISLLLKRVHTNTKKAARKGAPKKAAAKKTAQKKTAPKKAAAKKPAAKQVVRPRPAERDVALGHPRGAVNQDLSVHEMKHFASARRASVPPDPDRPRVRPGNAQRAEAIQEIVECSVFGPPAAPPGKPRRAKSAPEKPAKEKAAPAKKAAKKARATKKAAAPPEGDAPKPKRKKKASA